MSEPLLTPEDLALIRKEIAAGVVEGLKAGLSDDKLFKEFWKVGYAELTDHATNSTDKWIGSRIKTWFITSVFTVTALYLLNKKN